MHTKNINLKTAIAFLLSTLSIVGCKDSNANAQQKATVAQKQKAPGTDIHTAIATGNVLAVKQHIAAGTDINMKDVFGGSSPLITACLYNQKEIAKLLLNAGANINFQNNDGSTPLHVAAFFCKPEMVQLLLDKKADKTILNKYKSTAYESVATPFTVVKTTYEQMKQMLAPLGVQMDLAYIEKARPAIAKMLK